MTILNQYYFNPAAAYVRGTLSGDGNAYQLPFSDLGNSEIKALINDGCSQALRMQRFKRIQILPRVRKVIGMLHSLQPQNILDIGTGRGMFLWPLMDAFSCLDIHCIDILLHRVEFLQAVTSGGLDQLYAELMDASALEFEDSRFDIVTLLETLEHIPDTISTVREAVRVAKRAIILSVPSKPDNNPEHIHLFDQQMIVKIFGDQGVTNIKFDWVLNHLLVLAFK